MKKIDKLIRDYEKFLIATTLKTTKGNLEEAAKVLKIKSTTLYRKINKYNININHKRGGS